MSDAVARVEAFIEDFYAAWQRAGQVKLPFNPFTAAPGETFDPQAWAAAAAPDFAAWEEELSTLVGLHFTEGGTTGTVGMSADPDHQPDVETITAVEVARTRAKVRTEITHRGLTHYYEYRLSLRDREWRIVKLLQSYDPPGMPLLARKEARALVAAARRGAPLRAVAAGLELDLPALFDHPYEVIRLGEVTTISGALAVRDLGWGDTELSPLSRLVPPGTYPVEVARRGAANVAVRLRISDRRPATWHPADRVEGPHVVGVDAGNVAIADFESLARVRVDRLEEVCQEEIGKTVGSPGTVFALRGPLQDAAVVSSGYGDGSYPAYWGVAADGSLTELVVDFLVAVEDITTTITIPWRVGSATDAVLAEHEFEVVLDDDLVVFRLRQAVGERLVRRVEVRGPGGDAVAGEDRGSFVQGEVSQWRWQPDAGVPEDSTVHVTVSHGYRHV